MNNLLIFFALPIATIILAGIFQTIIKCPYKIAGITFAIYLIVAFALGGTAELIIAAIIYTILAFLTALLVMFFENNSFLVHFLLSKLLVSYRLSLLDILHLSLYHCLCL